MQFRDVFTRAIILAKGIVYELQVFFFNLGSIKSTFHHTWNHKHVWIFIFLPQLAKRAESASSTLTEPKQHCNFENKKKIVKKLKHLDDSATRSPEVLHTVLSNIKD